MTRFIELKDKLEELTGKAFAIFEQFIPRDKMGEVEHSGIILRNTESRVKSLEQFQCCVDIMNNTPEITALFGKVVGTIIIGQSAVDDAESIIFSFLLQSYSNMEQSFDEGYELFEEFFCSEHLRVKDEARLFNFGSHVPQIVLDDGLSIRRSFFDFESPKNQVRRQRYSFAIFAMISQYVIERVIEKDKIVEPQFVEDRNPENQNWTAISAELDEPPQVFDTVIKAMRILKSSAIFRGDITSKYVTFHPNGGETTRSRDFVTAVRGESCNVSEDEANELKEIYSELKLVTSKDKRLTIAMNRLFLGMERQFSADSFLDYMIALESLYLPDGNAELTFRLSLRVAWMLGENSEDRKGIYEAIRELYKKRSKIVHGSIENPDEDIVLELEDYLRKSIKEYLVHPEKYLEANLRAIYLG